MISKGFGLAAFFASVKASSVCIHSLKIMGILRFVVGVCAVLFHIMWISQHCGIVSVLKSNMEMIKVDIFTNI